MDWNLGVKSFELQQKLVSAFQCLILYWTKM